MLNTNSRRIDYILMLSALAFIFPGSAVPALSAGKIQAGTTLAHLHTAYNGESNAHARYLAFAKKAEAEGYGKVASLFRAVARAEQVHLNNHAAVIRRMGGEPKAMIKVSGVKSTRENLEAFAMKGEAYERDVMYPDFIKQANVEKNGDAAKTFELARTAEAEHHRLFAEALANLESMKGTGQTYYVCPICGYTTAEPQTGACVSCLAPGENYEPVG